jgi:hypothetical protein
MSARERLHLPFYLFIIGLVVSLPVISYFAVQALRKIQFTRMEEAIERAVNAIHSELTYSKDTGIRPRAPAEQIRGIAQLQRGSGEEEGVEFRQWRIQMGFAGYPESFLDSGFRLRLEQRRTLFKQAPVLRVIFSSKEEEKTLRGLVEGALMGHGLDYTVIVR